MGAFRERLFAALEQMSEHDLREVKNLLQGDMGQIARDVERLLTNNDRTVKLMISGEPASWQIVTALVPRKPRFIIAVTSDVDTTKIKKL